MFYHLIGFASSFSIVTSSLLSMTFLGFEPTQGFIAGASLVTYSVYLYSASPLKQEQLSSGTNGSVDNKSSDKVYDHIPHTSSLSIINGANVSVKTSDSDMMSTLSLLGGSKSDGYTR